MDRSVLSKMTEDWVSHPNNKLQDLILSFKLGVQDRLTVLDVLLSCEEVSRFHTNKSLICIIDEMYE